MVACFSLVVLYLEIVFSLSTVGGIFKGGFWYTMLFSIVYGTIGYLLSSIFKKKKINFWVSNIWMIATVVLYIVQIWYFWQAILPIMITYLPAPLW